MWNREKGIVWNRKEERVWNREGYKGKRECGIERDRRRRERRKEGKYSF